MQSFYLPLASLCQLPMQPRTHLRANFLGQHCEAKLLPYLFSLSFHPSSSCPLLWALFRIFLPFCWSLSAKPNWYLLLVLGPYVGQPLWVMNLSCSGPAAASWCRRVIGLIISCASCPHLSSASLADTRNAMPCQPTRLQAAQKSLARQARSPKQLTDLPIRCLLHEHRACLAAGKCFCTVPFQAKVLQPTGLQFKMSLWNVLCLPMEGGAGIWQLWDCSERQFSLQWAPLPSPEPQVHTAVTSAVKKILNDAEWSSLSCPKLDLLRHFWSSCEPPHPLLCRVLSTENQPQHDPQSLSYQFSVTNGNQIQIFTPIRNLSCKSVLPFPMLLLFLNL